MIISFHTPQVSFPPQKFNFISNFIPQNFVKYEPNFLKQTGVSTIYFSKTQKKSENIF
jgi:hypothetical protein